jgi:hypothetical protein
MLYISVYNFFLYVFLTIFSIAISSCCNLLLIIVEDAHVTLMEWCCCQILKLVTRIKLVILVIT